MFVYLGPLTRSLSQKRHPTIGFMVTPDSDRAVLADVTWAADNGCYAAGDRFDLDRYLAWLARPRGATARCLFATAPDVLGDARATWERSAPVLPLLRGLGYPPALVAQDGFDPDAVDWSLFDVLFIGGSTRWKRSDRGGFAAMSSAKARGARVHVGRVNGGPFLRHVVAAGADSADGTMLRFGPDRHWPLVVSWLDRLAAEPPQGRPMELFDSSTTPTAVGGLEPGAVTP